jgi:hypothetical protein
MNFHLKKYLKITTKIAFCIQKAKNYIASENFLESESKYKHIMRNVSLIYYQTLMRNSLELRVCMSTRFLSDNIQGRLRSDNNLTTH